MIDEPRVKIFTQWSPEAENAGIDDEASLLAESSPVSPPFVKAPIEDRSKYEKLAFNADEVSSDSDKEIAQRTEDRTKKKRRRMKAVLSRRRKDPSQDTNSASIGYDSDDSIGSASDLKAMNDEDCNGDNEDDREKIDETISESVRTCGSSAYHAECESVATHEDDHRLKKHRRHHREQQLPTIGADPVVGHQYGEKPLLLDDELDPEAKPEQTHGDPFVGHQYRVKPLINNGSSSDDGEKLKTLKNGIWKADEDVFALAPFPRSNSSRKSSCSRDSTKNAEQSITNSPLNSNLVTPIANSPIISGTLVDIDDEADANYSFVPPRIPKAVDQLKNSYNNFSLPRHRSKDTSQEETVQKDLFGSSPFSSSGFVFGEVDPFVAPDERLKMIHPVPKMSNPVPMMVNPTPVMANPTPMMVNQLPMYPDYSNSSLQYQNNFSRNNPVTSSSKFGVVTVKSVADDSEPKDLFGSIPFDEFTTLTMGIQERPTSLPLSQSPTFVDNALTTILSTSAQSGHSIRSVQIHSDYCRQVEHATRITIQATNSVSRSEINSDIVSPMSPEPLVMDDDSPKHRKEKSKADKSKYHLINENRSNTINVLPVKVAQKSKVSSYKKTPKKKSPAVAAGVSNMSFEDFPSDENDERHAGMTVAPFEVIREPEKRFGSLKRRSNPFT